MKVRLIFALSCLLVSVCAQASEPSLDDLCNAGQKINGAITDFFRVQDTSPGYDKVVDAIRSVSSTIDGSLEAYEVPADMLGLWETPDEFIQKAVAQISEQNEEMKKRLVHGDNFSAAIQNIDFDMAQLRRAVIKLLDRTCYTLG